MKENKMEVDTESVKLTVSNELIKEAISFSMKAHSTNQYYETNSKKHGSGSSSSSSVLIFAFKGSMGVEDFYHDDHFGETDVDSKVFPSLLRIGEGQLAKVNESFLQQFQNLLTNSKLISEVKNAAEKGKEILFTGHSSGGALASLATLWMLDEYTRRLKNKVLIGCVTFGSPLIGDRTLSHAVRREKWAGHFTHFVMEHDIVPRMMLAPIRSIQNHLPNILNFYQQILNPITTKKAFKFPKFQNKKTSTSTNDQDQLLDDNETVEFLENVLINASTVASHDAYDLMEPTDSLKETLSADFIKVSPYRPFGHYVFCTRGEDLDTPRQQLVVENPNAVLQLLFYFLQLPNEDQDLAQFARESLAENLSYEKEANNNGLQMVKRKKLLISNGTIVSTDNKALFELAASAKWCLLAVEEAENRKKKSMDWVKNSMRKYRQDKSDQLDKSDQPDKIDKTIKIIEDMFAKLGEYKQKSIDRKLDYYQAFKLQDKQEDFEANVDRLEQAKIWDVVIEMVKRKDLPDEFEVWDELVAVATQFRILYEPLDTANYYRHDKGDDTGYYMKDGVRPKRYRFTQRWYEHANVTGFELESESNFVAVVEELMREVKKIEKVKKIEEVKKTEEVKTTGEVKVKTIEEVKKDFERIEHKVKTWKSDTKIRNADVFWGELILSECKDQLVKAK